MAAWRQGDCQAAAPGRAAASDAGQGAASPLEDLMRRRGVDEAWTALEEMLHAGLPTTRFTVSRMLMKTLADARKIWDPARIQRSVTLVERFLQVQPEEADEILFNALLDTHCRMKNPAGLEATLRRMHELEIEPSHVTLGILVKAYGQACDIKSVLRLWDEMVEQRRQANSVTYGCMINACVRCGHTEKAVDIFNEMKQLRKHCNTILYTTLIKGYGNEKDLSSALSLFREMKEEGVPYNTIAYNSIIDVCIKCSELQTAEDIFREMLVPHSTVIPDLITYSTLLKGYCHMGNLDKALQVAETIKACGLKADELVYNTLMDGCVKANDLSAGVGLFAEMMQSGMRPSSITHSIFMRLYQRNGYKGNASEAVAQLYQHHGLERPMHLEKPSRFRGAKAKNWSGSGVDSTGQPLPPGCVAQAPAELHRGAGMPQVAPGCWNPTPASSLLHGLGAASAGHFLSVAQHVPLPHVPLPTRQHMDTAGYPSRQHMDAAGYPSQQHMDAAGYPSRQHMDAAGYPSRQHMDAVGYLSRQHTDTAGYYSGLSQQPVPGVFATQHLPMAGTAPLPAEATAMTMSVVANAVPWMQSNPSHMPPPVQESLPCWDCAVQESLPRWDCSEMQFPSLLQQQPQREDGFGAFGLDFMKSRFVEY